MIFVTVGTQLAFPRLVDAMDRFAAKDDEPVVAQTGEAANGRWSHLDVRPALAPDAFGTLMREARVVIAHAGIGTILSAQRFARPLILVPRKAELGEHRNDHQVATARQLENRLGLRVAWTIEALEAALEQETPPPMSPDGSPGRAAFLTALALRLADRGPS